MGYNDVHDAQRLKELQALPLSRKIQITQTRIIEWYQYFDGKVYVSFSGGKDSTVLLNIARQIYPDIKAVFVNTGLEYPEVRKFALSFDNVEEIRPVWGLSGKKRGKRPDEIVTFRDTITFCGYPIITKEISQAIYQARAKPDGKQSERMHGLYYHGTGHDMWDFSKYLPVLDLPIKISDECCTVSKKRPNKKFQKESGLKAITGQMASESLRRKTAWIKNGCNAFDSSHPISNPMSFWTNQDVLYYIAKNNIKIASVYGRVILNQKTGRLECTECDRTGCIFCAFGAHREQKGNSRFKRLSNTHPKLYDYCIHGGGWQKNPDYKPELPVCYEGCVIGKPWNPKYLWMPTDKGLGMGKVFDMMNDIYGKDFITYE